MSLRPRKRTLLLAGVAATGLLWLISWGLIHGWYPELQRRLLLAALERGLHLDAELAAARGSLVSGLRLEGLLLGSPKQGGAQPTAPLAIDRVEISLDLRRLIEDRLLIVEALEIDGVAIRLVRTLERRWQLAGLAVEPAVNSGREAPPLRVEIARVRIRNAVLSARWQDARGPGQLVANGSFSTRDLAWPNESAPALPASFRADLELSEGALGALRLRSGRLKLERAGPRLELALQRASVRAEHLGRFHVSGSAEIDLSGAAPSLANADARIGFTQLDLAGIAAHYELATELPDTQLNGGLRVEFGPEGARDLRFEVSLDPSRLDSFALHSARAQLDYRVATQHWKLAAAEIAMPFGKFDVSGSGSLDSFETLRVDASQLPIEAVAEALGLDVDFAGHFDLAAELAGPMRDPLGSVALQGRVEAESGRDDSLEASVSSPVASALDFSLDLGLRGAGRYRIEGLELGVDAQPPIHFASSSPGELRRSEDAWLLSGLRLRGPGGAVTIEAARSDGERQVVELELESLDLAPLSAHYGRTTPLEGTVTGPLTIGRAAGGTRLDADLVWHQPAYAGFGADWIHLVSHSSARANAVEAAIDYGAGSPLRLSAQLPGDRLGAGLPALVSHPAFRLAISAQAVPATTLGRLFAPPGDPTQSLAGTLSGEFRATGSDTGPQLTGSASWSEARFGSAVADDVSLRCRTEAGVALLDLEISHAGRNGFVAEAAIDLAGWLARPDSLFRDEKNRASLRAEDVDLGWLVPRASARRLGRIENVYGRATGQLSIEGSPDGPRLAGDLRIHEAELQLALVKQHVGPIDGHLHFSNEEVRIERIEIASKKGPAILTGSYRWQALGPGVLQLEARFEKFALTHFPLLDARVYGQLDLTGSLDALDVRGDLVFKRVGINLPAAEDPLFREVRILGLEGDDAKAADPRGESEPTAYQRMRADIAIDVRRGTRIRGRGTDLEAEGQFRLHKKRLSPTLLQGSLHTTGGTYTFLGRKFEVSEGTATFEERTPPDPELHLIAMRPSGGVTVGVELTGRWSDRHSRLISVPPMDNSEILSYLVFDKPTSEIGEGDDNQLNAAAAQLAGNLALSQLSQALSDRLPINEISMDVNENLGLASIGVETNVGEDIIVRYDRAIQNGLADRFSVEWRFWKNLSLRSEYSNGGTSGLDLFWSYEY